MVQERGLWRRGGDAENRIAVKFPQITTQREGMELSLGLLAVKLKRGSDKARAYEVCTKERRVLSTAYTVRPVPDVGPGWLSGCPPTPSHQPDSVVQL